MKTIVVKLGGAALFQPSAWEAASGAVAELRAQGHRVLIVHGGGPAINQALTAKGITWEFFEGQRITTVEMMATIEEALWAVNRRLCQTLAQLRVPYTGLVGKDGGLLECRLLSEKLGLVGEVQSVRGGALTALLEQGLTPVVCPIGHGGQGQGLNVNADWAAVRIASAIKADDLLFLTDQKGILDAPEGALIAQLSVAQLRGLVQSQVVTGGMLTKTRAILDALENGVTRVRVMAALDSPRFAQGDEVGTCCGNAPSLATGPNTVTEYA